jgi:hypothetical protein
LSANYLQLPLTGAQPCEGGALLHFAYGYYSAGHAVAERTDPMMYDREEPEYGRAYLDLRKSDEEISRLAAIAVMRLCDGAGHLNIRPQVELVRNYVFCEVDAERHDINRPEPEVQPPGDIGRAISKSSLGKRNPTIYTPVVFLPFTLEQRRQNPASVAVEAMKNHFNHDPIYVVLRGLEHIIDPYALASTGALTPIQRQEEQKAAER